MATTTTMNDLIRVYLDAIDGVALDALDDAVHQIMRIDTALRAGDRDRATEGLHAARAALDRCGSGLRRSVVAKQLETERRSHAAR